MIEQDRLVLAKWSITAATSGREADRVELVYLVGRSPKGDVVDPDGRRSAARKRGSEMFAVLF